MPNPPRPAAFAIPGDIDQRTGGYIYERSLLMALRAAGRQVGHIQLPGSFPDPSPADMAATVGTLAALPPEAPLILDGLVCGAIDTEGLATVRAPIVAMIHHPLGLETGLPEARARELLRREAANLALATHVLVPSPHTARVLAADFSVPAARITVAPPGFTRPEPGLAPETPPLILSVGLLCRRKGHDVLVLALSRIAALEWRAEIVGGTHDPGVAAALDRQIAEAGLASRVRVRGVLSAGELDARYRAATVFALATRYEGYGMVLAEALGYGLPIVSTRAGAVPDTMPEGAGILVDIDDSAALASALRRLLTDPALRAAMAQRSAAAAAALPAWPDTAALVGAVLDRV